MKSKFLMFNCLAALALVAAVLFFAPDPAAAASFMLMANAPAALELKALEAGMKEFGEKMGLFMKEQAEQLSELKVRLREVELKGAKGPMFGGHGDSDNPAGAIARLVVDSPNLESFQKSANERAVIELPHMLIKSAITNPGVTSQGDVNALVPADRRPGIVMPPMRRFAVRDVMQNIRTTSGMVEYARESSFTNNASIQGAGSSPAATEGQPKSQSALAFTLQQESLRTVAHWVPASRQILSDAPQLERYVGGRLVYGLKYAEEDQFLNGDGSAGNIDGLINQATAFNGGVTNQTAIDTIAKAMLQLMASDYMPTGVILNPQDWVNMMLAKDSEGNYILGNPQNMTEPRLWGLPVAATNTMPAGHFIVLDATRAGFIADREDAVIRISEHHEDFFVRNMVVILAEERTTLVVEQPGAIIYGNVSHAG